MKTFFLVFIGYILFGGAFFFALNSTLEDMTQRDCEVHNIARACQVQTASY